MYNIEKSVEDTVRGHINIQTYAQIREVIASKHSTYYVWAINEDSMSLHWLISTLSIAIRNKEYLWNY